MASCKLSFNDILKEGIFELACGRCSFTADVFKVSTCKVKWKYFTTQCSLHLDTIIFDIVVKQNTRASIPHTWTGAL